MADPGGRKCRWCVEQWGMARVDCVYCGEVIADYAVAYPAGEYAHPMCDFTARDGIGGTPVRLAQDAEIAQGEPNPTKADHPA